MKKMIMVLAMAGLSLPLWADPLPAQPHVYVEGSAEVEAEPDMMTFSLSIQAQNLDLASAKADVDARSKILIDACKKFGIKLADMTTNALAIRPEYDYRDQQRVFAGNHVSRQIDIVLRDLKKYPEMMKALVDAKVSETINTALTVSNKKALEDKAQIAAMTDAKNRAEQLAKTQGKTLGDPWSISEFNTRGNDRWELQTNRQLMGASAKNNAEVRMSIDAAEPFEPGLMTLSAQVYVVYLLK